MLNLIMMIMQSNTILVWIMGIAFVIMIIGLLIDNEKIGKVMCVSVLVIDGLLAVGFVIDCVVTNQVRSQTSYKEIAMPVSTWGENSNTVQVLTKDHKIIAFNTAHMQPNSNGNIKTNAVTENNKNKIEYHYSLKNRKTNVKLIKCTAKNVKQIKQYHLQSDITLKYYKFVINKPLNKE